jgi:xanthine dehydrogenase YagR molybdenum-binding subunit
VRLSATAEGNLTSLQQDYLNHTSILDDYEENCGEATPYLYGTPNLRVTSGLVRRNIGTPSPMRGPGAVPGLFATESAMDELAIKLKMDPVELRLLNEPEKDESNGLPFSSRHLTECFTLGAQKFGWSQRTPEVGSMTKDGLVLGWGMASCSWIAERAATEATVDLRSDGTARVSCGTQDIGTGTYTILAQIVGEKTGLPLDKIEVVLGDTALPPGPISGGSWTTASVIPAVSQAAQNAMQVVLTAATKGNKSPFAGQETDALNFGNARVYLKEKGPDTGVVFQDILKQSNINAASGNGKSAGTFGSTEPRKYSTHSFGAHFVEVTWQPEIARLRVSRVVTVIDAGRIMNSRPARNQIEGSVVMGVGMAFLEKTTYDPRNGAPINSNLADYMVATHADAPEIDVTFLDYPDTVLNEFGARGIGEIGHAGIAAALTSAVYHATGVRVRELPVHIEDLLAQT